MAAAPEAVTLPPLAVFLLTAVCIALIYAYKATLGAVITTLANALDVKLPVVGRPFHFLVTGANALNSQVQNLLGLAVEANQRAWHIFVHWQAVIWQQTTDALADLAEATQHELHRLASHVIPASITGQLSGLWKRLAALSARLAALAAIVAHLPHVVTHAVTRELVPVKTYVQKVTRIVVQSAPFVIPALRIPAIPRVGQIERDLHGIDERLRDLAKRAAPSVAIGVVAAAVARLGLSWGRCSNAQRYGKNVCGMDQDLLDSLIADTLLVLGTVSLVEFAQGLQTVVSEAARETGVFWRA